MCDRLLALFIFCLFSFVEVSIIIQPLDSDVIAAAVVVVVADHFHSHGNLAENNQLTSPNYMNSFSNDLFTG